MSKQNSFEFKQFKIIQDKCAMKVGTDAVLVGAWTEYYKPKRILDIGTGTGIIAIMMAQKFPQASIDAIDIDTNSFIQAIENVSNSPWKERISVQLTALQDFICADKYDIIVTNPPYFINSFKAPEESRTLARHTDELPFEILIESVKELLRPKGNFYLILPSKEAEIFNGLAQQYNLYLTKRMKVRTKRDKEDIKRCLLRYELEKNPYSELELIIEEETPMSYTEEYKELTKEFYKR